MKLNLWMIVNRLGEMDIETHIKRNSGRTMRSARMAYAPNCAYIHQDGDDVICADETDYIRIKNIEKNVAFEIIQGIFDFYDSWSEELEQVISQKNNSELLQVLWKVFQNPMILFNASQGVEAMTRQYGYGEVDEEWDYILRYGSSSMKGLQQVRNAGKQSIHQNVKPQKVVMKKDSVITPYLAAVIMNENVRIGQILIIESKREINFGDIELLTYAVSRIEKSVRERHQNCEDLNMNVLLDLILEKPISFEDLDRQMMQLGWKRDDQYRVLVVYAGKNSADEEKQLHLIHNAIRSFFNSIGCFTYKNQVIMIMNDSIQAPEYTRPHTRRIMEENNGIVTGGYRIEGIENLRFSYQQALWAFERGQYGVGGRNRYDYFTCALDYLVHCIWAEKTDVPLMLYSCHPDVLKLWKLDLETEGYYVETLVEYLQNERSLVKTANALHIHRSTLIYRTKKLEELMETDLSDPYNREYILTSVRVLKHFAKEVPYINTIKV